MYVCVYIYIYIYIFTPRHLHSRLLRLRLHLHRERLGLALGRDQRLYCDCAVCFSRAVPDCAFLACDSRRDFDCAVPVTVYVFFAP